MLVRIFIRKQQRAKTEARVVLHLKTINKTLKITRLELIEIHKL